jgi:hypothetical protein
MGVTLALIIALIGYTLGIVGAARSVRYIIKHNAKGLLVYSTKEFLKRAGMAFTGAILNTIVGLLKTVLDFSFGRALSIIWDRLDRYRKNGVCEFDFRRRR